MGTDRRTPFRIINWTDKTEREERYSTCLNCEKVNLKYKICGECGCFILGISKLADKHCPIGKF